MSFTNIVNATRTALTGKRGAAMVEYALLAGLIAVVAIAGLQALGTNINSKFDAISTSL